MFRAGKESCCRIRRLRLRVRVREIPELEPEQYGIVRKKVRCSKNRFELWTFAEICQKNGSRSSKKLVRRRRHLGRPSRLAHFKVSYRNIFVQLPKVHRWFLPRLVANGASSANWYQHWSWNFAKPFWNASKNLISKKDVLPPSLTHFQCPIIIWDKN